MTAGAQEDLARAINRDFDRMVACQRTGGAAEAIQAARASAFAAVAFLDQVSGRRKTLDLIDELLDA